jgi:hypothetical protein
VALMFSTMNRGAGAQNTDHRRTKEADKRVLVNGKLIVVPAEYTAADLAKAIPEIKGEAFARWRKPLREGDQVKDGDKVWSIPHRSTKGTPLSVRMRLAKPDSLNSARTRTTWATLLDESAWQANIQLLPMCPLD